MPRTVSQYLDLMRHALGLAAGTDPRSGHTLLDTFNDAGEMLVTAYPWRFCETGPVEVPCVLNQSWVELPPSFRGLEHVGVLRQGEPAYTQVRVTSPEDVRERLATQFPMLDGVIRVAVGGSMPGGHSGGAARRVLLIHPLFQSGTAPTLALTYRRGWTPMTDTTLVPDLPEEFETAMVMAARMRARQIEDQDDGYERERFEAELQRLRTTEGVMQPTAGRLGRSVGFTQIDEHPIGTIVADT